MDHNKLENSSRDGNTRPPDLSLEKSVAFSLIVESEQDKLGLVFLLIGLIRANAFLCSWRFRAAQENGALRGLNTG